VIVVAERLGATHVATIDDRHSRAVRPAHCAAFESDPDPTKRAGEILRAEPGR
jgi:hypothetical protein